MPADSRYVGKYHLVEELASGGMATVYLALAHGSVGFRKVVAVKRCHPQFSRDPEFVAMFTDEARLTSHISHPNVVETLDVFRHEGELLLVLAYVHGVPLAVMASKQRALGTRFPHPVAVAVLSGILDGLEAAHCARGDSGEPLGIVHRDVSPQNILVGIDGTPRLIDFGVAHAIERHQVTADGQVKGKFSYMAPEQLSREGMDGRADVWSLAVVAWELLAGKRLITGDLGQMVQDILTLVPPDVRAFDPSVPEALALAVARGLRRDPRERWASAAEMAAALRAALAPAPPRDVEAAVRWLGATELARRDQVVARARGGGVLDEDTTVGRRAPPHGSPFAGEIDGHDGTLGGGGTRTAAGAVGTHAGLALSDEMFALSSLGSASAPTQLTRRRGSPWKPAAVAVVVSLAGGTALALTREMPAVSSSATLASAALPAIASAEPVPAPSTRESSTAPGVAVVLPPLPSSSSRRSPPPRSTSGSVAKQTPPTDSCADPGRAFVVGPDGVRRLRQQCR